MRTDRNSSGETSDTKCQPPTCLRLESATQVLVKPRETWNMQNKTSDSSEMFFCRMQWSPARPQSKSLKGKAKTARRGHQRVIERLDHTCAGQPYKLFPLPIGWNMHSHLGQRGVMCRSAHLYPCYRAPVFGLQCQAHRQPGRLGFHPSCLN